MFSKTLGKAPESVVIVGSGGSATVQIRSETLTNPETEELRTALFDAFQPKGSDGQPSQAGHQRLGGVGDLGRADHQEGAHRAGGVPRARHHLHHGALRAVYGDVRAGDDVLRPGRHRGCVLAGGLRGHPGHRDRPADDPRLLALRHRHRVRQGRGEHPRLRTHHPPHLRRTGQPGDQPDVHAVDQHQPDLGAADHRADGRRGVAARGRHAQGSGPGAAGRCHRRQLLVDLLGHPAAGDVARAHRAGSHAHPAGAQPPQAAAKAAEVARGRRARRQVAAAALAATPAPDKPAPGARPVRPTASRTGRPSGKRNVRRR